MPICLFVKVRLKIPSLFSQCVPRGKPFIQYAFRDKFLHLTLFSSEIIPSPFIFSVRTSMIAP